MTQSGRLPQLEDEASLDKPSSEVSSRRFEPATNWMHTAAVMMLAEIPWDVIALQLGKPFNVIAQLTTLAEFRHLIQHLSKDGEEKAAQKLIRGSAVDNVLTLMKLRSDEKVKPEVRAKCAMYLLDHALGKSVEKTKKTALGEKKWSEELLSDGQEGVDAAVALDSQISKLLDAHPELKQQYNLQSSAQ